MLIHTLSYLILSTAPKGKSIILILHITTVSMRRHDVRASRWQKTELLSILLHGPVKSTPFDIVLTISLGLFGGNISVSIFKERIKYPQTSVMFTRDFL